MIVNRKFTIKYLIFEADEVARRLLLSEEIGKASNQPMESYEPDLEIVGLDSL